MITRDGKTFLRRNVNDQKPGVIIIPDDASYVRFVSNSWYDDEAMDATLNHTQSVNSDMDLPAEMDIERSFSEWIFNTWWATDIQYTSAKAACLSLIMSNI